MKYNPAGQPNKFVRKFISKTQLYPFQGGNGHYTRNYSYEKMFNTFSYLFALKLWVLLLNFNWVVQTNNAQIFQQ